MFLNLSVIFFLHFFNQPVKVLSRFLEVFKAVLAPAAAALAMAGTVYGARQWLADMPATAALAILVPLGGAVYLGLLWTFARQRLQEALAFATRKQIGAD